MAAMMLSGGSCLSSSLTQVISFWLFGYPHLYSLHSASDACDWGVDVGVWGCDENNNMTSPLVSFFKVRL